jgi:hypothetical protein
MPFPGDPVHIINIPSVIVNSATILTGINILF